MLLLQVAYDAFSHIPFYPPNNFIKLHFIDKETNAQGAMIGLSELHTSQV